MPTQPFQSCIDTCNDVVVACNQCAAACLAEKDPKPLGRCITLDLDCAAICRTAVEYMARNSELATMLCEVVAEVCDACAQECARHEHDHCQQCAEVCKICADECRKMTGDRPHSRDNGRLLGSTRH